MAVQAPCYLFSSPHFPPSRAQSNLLDDLQMLQHHPFRNHGGAATAAAPAAGAVASGTQQSGLTTDASASRKKRRRDDEQPPMTAAIASGEVAPVTQSRLLASMAASTSGQPSLAGDVASLFSQHNAEIDALVHLQNERLRKMVVEAAMKQQRSLLVAAEERTAKRLKIKEAELVAAAKKNVELEERVRQAAAESQFWFAAASSSEAVARSLRATLEQTLQQGMQGKSYRKAPSGSNDSDCYVVEADDEESCCFDSDDLQRQRIAGNDGMWSCRSCGKKEVCVLLLPCRHLCLCKDCEPRQELCPVCNEPKNASLRVFTA